jgi:hypothetical protein
MYTVECILPSGRKGQLRDYQIYMGVKDESCFIEQVFVFHDSSGQCRQVTGIQLAEELGFEYCSHLKFLHESYFRNYYFWGLDPQYADIPSTGSIGARQQLEDGAIHSGVSIRHIGVVAGIDVGYGLFCDIDVESGSVIGEYVGCIMPSDTMTALDYSLVYPSQESFHINARDVGNVMRLANHSSCPNSEFRQFMHDGLVHILCVTARTISSGEQVTVDYGEEYWHRQGVTPADI